MTKSERFWDQRAAKYSRSPIKDMASYEKTLQKTRERLSPDDRVLEIGCGTGSTALLLADSVAHITATDFSAKMIEIANAKLEEADAPQNVKFQKATVFDDAFQGKEFDAVLAFNFLHLAEDLEAVLAEVRRMVKSGGFFVSKSVCLGDKSFHFYHILVPLMKLIGQAPYVRFLKTEELETAIKDAGFDIIESELCPPPGRLIFARAI
ncbi:MAG: class I SAM-dependent methyltransferase [Pseudomonadota bacterium]